MRKNNKKRALLATLLALAMLLCSFPVYAENMNTETPAVEMTQEVKAEAIPEETPAAPEVPETVPEETPAAPEAPEAVPEETPTAPEVPEVIPEETTAAPEAPEAVPEETPAAPEAPEAVPDETPVAPEAPEVVPEETPAAPEAPEVPDDREEGTEDIFCYFDDDDPGSVSPELLDLINNPGAYQKIDFAGTVDIGIKNSIIAYDQDVTLVASVSGAESLDYFMIWEASDDQGSNWYAIGKGSEYTYVLTRDNVGREYRVVLYTTC